MGTVDISHPPDVRLEPVDGPSAWYGRDLADRDDWIEQLDRSEVDQILGAVRAVDAAERPILELTRDDFPFTTPLAARLQQLGRELDRGRGFWLLRGLPIEELSDHEAAVAFWGLGLHLGTPVSQNARGHLLGHVTDEGRTLGEPGARGYQTRAALPFHTDSSDAVGLLCLRTAKSGGASAVASTTTVFNETVRRRPDLAPMWFDEWYFDRRNETRDGDAPFYRTPLAVWHADLLSIRYVRGFMDSAQRHDDVPRRTDREREFLDLIDEIAHEPGVALHMKFEPGDIQFVCNYSTFHSRTAYEDHPEPDRRRHLLRLWISLHEGRPLPESFGRGVTAGLSGRGGIAPVPGVAEAHAGTNI